MVARAARRTRSRGRFPFAGAYWLGLLALGIQTLLPLLVALEMQLATGDGPLAEAFEFCPLGHVHAAADRDHHHQPADSHPHHQGLTDGCAVCLALHGGQAFTAAPALVLPAPGLGGEALSLAAPVLGSLAAIPASYHPRAPPALG